MIACEMCETPLPAHNGRGQPRRFCAECAKKRNIALTVERKRRQYQSDPSLRAYLQRRKQAWIQRNPERERAYHAEYDRKRRARKAETN